MSTTQLASLALWAEEKVNEKLEADSVQSDESRGKSL